MATLSFEQNQCDKLLPSDVKDKFINLDEAKQRYADRIGEDNPVNGFLLTLQNLKDLITKIENFNLSVSADNPDDKIEYIRIWKARSR